MYVHPSISQSKQRLGINILSTSSSRKTKELFCIHERIWHSHHVPTLVNRHLLMREGSTYQQTLFKFNFRQDSCVSSDLVSSGDRIKSFWDWPYHWKLRRKMFYLTMIIKYSPKKKWCTCDQLRRLGLLMICFYN